jgi:hypothetical protein
MKFYYFAQTQRRLVFEHDSIKQYFATTDDGILKWKTTSATRRVPACDKSLRPDSNWLQDGRPGWTHNFVIETLKDEPCPNCGHADHSAQGA